MTNSGGCTNGLPKDVGGRTMWPVKRGPGAFLSKQITCWRGIIGDSIKALLDHGEVGVLALCDHSLLSHPA
ncbi:hypothetical protein BFJ67_g7866 [Fusarium oxysporum f. sp. cepae]|nr:hypothetical protein BFJ67_g7866 [Fusarium oxysporum f. sp. cepae]